MPQFEVVGSNYRTGAPIVTTIEANNLREAQGEAVSRGINVSQVNGQNVAELNDMSAIEALSLRDALRAKKSNLEKAGVSLGQDEENKLKQAELKASELFAGEDEPKDILAGDEDPFGMEVEDVFGEGFLDAVEDASKRLAGENAPLPTSNTSSSLPGPPPSNAPPPPKSKKESNQPFAKEIQDAVKDKSQKKKPREFTVSDADVIPIPPGNIGRGRGMGAKREPSQPRDVQDVNFGMQELPLPSLKEIYNLANLKDPNAPRTITINEDSTNQLPGSVPSDAMQQASLNQLPSPGGLGDSIYKKMVKKMKDQVAAKGKTPPSSIPSGNVPDYDSNTVFAKPVPSAKDPYASPKAPYAPGAQQTMGANVPPPPAGTNYPQPPPSPPPPPPPKGYYNPGESPGSEAPDLMEGILTVGGKLMKTDPYSIALQALLNAKEKAGESLTRLGQATQTEKPTEMASSILGSAASAVEMAPGGELVSWVFKLVKVIPDAIEGLRDWAKNLHNANMKFADFSAAMASVQARQEVRDIQLSRERGDRRADSAETLAQGKHRLEESLSPWEDKLASIWNEKIGEITLTLGFTLEKVNEIAKGMGILTDDDKQTGLGLGEQMSHIAEARFSETYGRPPRLPRTPF